MSTALQSDLLLETYRKHQDQLIVHRLKIACVLSIIIVPAAASMDWVMYPKLFAIFFINRLACALLLGVILFLLFKPFARSKAHSLAQVWVNIMLGYNAVMILLSDGVLSPYYAGLNLVVLGACVLLPWTFGENLAACLSSLIWYFLACSVNWLVRGPPEADPWFATFFNNTFLTLSNIAICGTAGYFAEQLRFRDFRLQYELDQNQKALAESYGELEKNKRALEESYQKLEDLSHAKTLFFANISHELRTPLTLILSPLDGLRRLPGLSRDEKVQGTLDLMYQNGLRLLALINDLLDLVRLERHQFELRLEPVDLKHLLPGVVSAMRGVAERCGQSMEIDLDASASLVVQADKDRLEKVFINLLFNAVKFTPEGGFIRVSAAPEDGSVRVEIQDSGIGIAEENLPQVFGRFWQEDNSATRARPGTGIGLALVKEIVELHHGTVSVTSQKGAGSTFGVRLPRSNELPVARVEEKKDDAWLAELYRKAQYMQGEIIAPAESSSESKSSGGYKPTLLIIEDEMDMQRFLAAELREAYSVILASDGSTGWDLAHKHQPKLIITDMMLPQIDGITLCRKLRSSPSLLPTKIIVLTAHADDQTKLSALQAGADDFLTKPFSTVELKTRLANLLLTSQLERELQSQNQALEAALRQLRAAETQLVQNARLSALGSLSAGIMHEINNPVNFLLTATHYLKTSLPQDASDAQSTAKDIQDGLERIRDIIADLKNFAYGGAPAAKGECDPAKILRTTKRLLASEIKEDVLVEERVDNRVPLFGNENQLVQLLVNVLQNALHATAKNAAQKKPRKLKIRMEPASELFLISVWDNGTGISKENQAKIFDPFFTTKEVGAGMGLGLSISHTIVKQHGGEISVKSEPGQFTEFMIQLPLSDPAPEGDSAGGLA